MTTPNPDARLREAADIVRDFADEVGNIAHACCTDPDGDPDEQISVNLTGNEGARIADAMHRLADASLLDRIEALEAGLRPFADAGEYLDLETDGFLGDEKLSLYFEDHELFDALKFRDFIKAYKAFAARDLVKGTGDAE